MKDAPAGKEFIFQDGKKIKNVSELLTYLELNGQSLFHNFVNSQKNDFANWIEYVLEDKVMSEKLRGTQDLSETLKILKSDLSQNVKNMSSDVTEKEASATSQSQSAVVLETSKVSLEVSPKKEDSNKVSSNETSVHSNRETIVNNSDGLYTEQKDEKIKSEKQSASKKWFKYAQKKIEDKNDKKEKKDPHVEIRNNEEHTGGDVERVIWMLIYIFVIALIIFLAIYKLVLT